jgi:hypothetical protein
VRHGTQEASVRAAAMRRKGLGGTFGMRVTGLGKRHLEQLVDPGRVAGTVRATVHARGITAGPSAPGSQGS